MYLILVFFILSLLLIISSFLALISLPISLIVIIYMILNAGKLPFTSTKNKFKPLKKLDFDKYLNKFRTNTTDN